MKYKEKKEKKTGNRERCTKEIKDEKKIENTTFYTQKKFVDEYLHHKILVYYNKNEK